MKHCGANTGSLQFCPTLRSLANYILFIRWPLLYYFTVTLNFEL